MLILVTDGLGISPEITVRWMPLDLSDGNSTLVQVMTDSNKPLPEPMLTRIYVSIWRY